MPLFGFESLADMVDGGGAGQSGSTYSTEGSSFDTGDDPTNNYQDPYPSGTGARDPRSPVRPVSRPTITVSGDGGSFETTRGADNQASFAQLNPTAAGGNFSEYAPGEVNERNNFAQRAVRNHPLSQGLGYLTGTSPDNDQVVNLVDGNPIRQRENGSYYALNMMGIPYDVAGPDSLSAVQSQGGGGGLAASMGGAGSEAEGPAADFSDPCPEGYVYDQEAMMCVIDTAADMAPMDALAPTPAASPYALPDPMSVTPGGAADYTQPMGNFIPTPLQPNPSSPIQTQLDQLARSLRGPQQGQGQRPMGLSGANTGIMQVRP